MKMLKNIVFLRIFHSRPKGKNIDSGSKKKSYKKKECINVPDKTIDMDRNIIVARIDVRSNISVFVYVRGKVGVRAV